MKLLIIDCYAAQFQDGDATLIKSELGWEPKYTICETIKDLLDYWVHKIQ